MLHIHHWASVRDDGYWYYQACIKCQKRRVKQKEGGLAGQPANPVWMSGGKLPTPIGEKGGEA